MENTTAPTVPTTITTNVTTKYVIVTGGVVSGIGKGITASSIAHLLKQHGLNVTAVKIDPYLNVDAGLMAPFEHGETYVLADGTECDLDLGSYERYLNTNLSGDNSITSGRVYDNVIKGERNGKYLGKTVQIVPHITDEIQRLIATAATGFDICCIELGGVIGDIESAPFIEALRQLICKVGSHKSCTVHVSMVPMVGAVGEYKTKPTQQSCAQLRSYGISPDFIVCRSDTKLEPDTLSKVSVTCGVPNDHVIGCHDAISIYHVPGILSDALVDINILKKFGIDCMKTASLKTMDRFLRMYPLDVHIGLVGKYTHLRDSYISVKGALEHAASAMGLNLKLTYFEAETLGTSLGTTSDTMAKLQQQHGVIIPGGFGQRGTSGLIAAVAVCRRMRIPLFGICLGLQIMSIEFARNVLGFATADSTEFNPDTPFPAVNIAADTAVNTGILQNAPAAGNATKGTMLLGNRDVVIDPRSHMYNAYGRQKITERFRHRYHIVEKYFKGSQLVVTARTSTHVAGMELPLKVHPFYVGVQYHPEFTSRLETPHPLFREFLIRSAAHAE